MSTSVLARDRGLRREYRDCHGTRTPSANIAAVIGDLRGTVSFLEIVFVGLCEVFVCL